MKQIKISEEQKEKLLEMCEALFPEYFPVHLELEPQYDGFEFNYMEDSMSNIHWYEFTMTHLCEKILNPTPKLSDKGLIDKFKDFFWESNIFWANNDEKTKTPFLAKHPIDFLYKEFKKL